MNFENKPRATASYEKDGDGWVVVTLNADGKARQERPFSSQAEAKTFWLAELGRIREQM